MSRFFAFGCSFTNYAFPTWADLISDNFDYYENWGSGGGGNHYIFNSLIECHQRHKITADDTIIICWTNTGREDRYTTRWIGNGNIYSQELYDMEWVKRFITERGCMIRDFAFIRCADLLLQSFNCKFSFFSTVPFFWHNDFTETYNKENVKNQDVYDLYYDSLKITKPSFLESVFNGAWQHTTPTGEQRDVHPSPNEHLQYLKMHTDFQISNTMLELAEKETKRFFENSKLLRPKYQSLWKTTQVKRF
jgi:hypothetical protein